MAEFTIHVENDHMDEIIAECNRRAKAALQLCGAQCERNAKINLEHSPRRIDTGLLRNSITYAMAGGSANIASYSGDNPSRYRMDDTIPSGSYSGEMPVAVTDTGTTDQAVYVGTNVEYAPYVHEGTQRMAPNRFLRNAMSEHIPEYKAIIEKVLKGNA